MIRRQLTRLIVGLVAVLTGVCVCSRGIAAPQEESKKQSAPAEKDAKEKVAPQTLATAEMRAATITKMLGAFDVKPHPPKPIPDDPPPHEGAMIGVEYIIEPPDLILVEILEALPGRPISGERLVKPDGTISLGFYGDVFIRGMTLRQAKVAIIKHLRTFLNDDASVWK